MTELRAFKAMLERAFVGHGTRASHSPSAEITGTVVLVEHPDETARGGYRLSEWTFDVNGSFAGVELISDEHNNPGSG